MPRKPHSAETKAKISQALRASWETKKQPVIALSAADKNRQLVLMTLRETKHGGLPLTPQAVQAVLVSTENGQMERIAEFFDQMLEGDPHLAGLYRTRIQAISGKDMEVEPADDSDISKRAAEFIRIALSKVLGFNDALAHLSKALFTGLSLDEKVWEYIDAKLGDERISFLGIERLNPIHLKKLRFDQDFELVITTRFGGNEEIKVSEHPNSFVCHSPNIGGEYPNKRGLFRQCAWFYLFKKLGMKYWLGGAEKFSFPVIFGKVPDVTPLNIRQDIEAQLRQMATDSVGVIDNNVDVLTIGGQVTGGSDVWSVLEAYFDSQYTKLILGGTLTVEAGTTHGSKALGEVHERVREDFMMADAVALAETIKMGMIVPLLEQNLHLFGGVMPPVPNIYFDVKKREFDKIEEWHVRAGVIRNNDVRRQLGLPLFEKELGEQLASFTVATPTPQIYQYHLTGKMVRRNDVRKQLGLDLLSDEEGGNELMDIVQDPAQAPALSEVIGNNAPTLPLSESKIPATISHWTKALEKK